MALLGTNSGNGLGFSPGRIEAPTKFVYSLTVDASGSETVTNIAETDPSVRFTPSLSGTKPITFSISPALPGGLQLDPNTEIISGTPTVWSLPNEYTITAQNQKRTAAAKITFSTTTPGRVTGTGITKCCSWSVNQEIPCGDSSYPNKDADFPKPRSFTGPTQHPVYTDDYTTRDNVKSLVWKSCLEVQTGADCSRGSTAFINYTESETACSDLNSANNGNGYAGIRNWRLQIMQELFSTADLSINYALQSEKTARGELQLLWVGRLLSNIVIICSLREKSGDCQVCLKWLQLKLSIKILYR